MMDDIDNNIKYQRHKLIRSSLIMLCYKYIYYAVYASAR